MSLFPAYSVGKANETSNVNKDSEKEWLSNNSFGVSTSVNRETIDQSSKSYDDDDDIQNITKTKRKHRKDIKKNKKEKKKKKHKNDSPVSQVIEATLDKSGLYFIDQIRHLDYLNYKTLTKPVKPRYDLNFKGPLGMNIKNYDQQKKVKRYYYYPKGKTECHDASMDDELTIMQKTEEFNKKLCETSNVSEWIAFVEFQDEFFESQHILYNSEKEKKKAIFQKKMGILEKAMNYNPKNEELQKYWLKIANEILPPDEICKHMEKMLELFPENLSLWLSLISIRQYSLALCTIPSVTELYKRALNGLCRTKTQNITERDTNLIELLFHYCKFLEQCGHWEMLWTILNKNLNLNFGIELNFNLCMEDERVKEMENEIIANEKQPIWVTWRRLETLREGVHFMPVTESLDYPQRCVSNQDIIDFVLHFHRDNQFRLIILVIFLLKVPLLPVNNTVLKMLFKNGLPWILDSSELILSSVFHSPAVNVKVHHLRHLVEITRGPQYLRNMEGQFEFLELIQSTFQECLKFLEGKQNMSLALWFLRYNRWLYFLDKHKIANLPVRMRKVKHFFKDFMKNKENRDNLLFYCEYGLFEYNQGNIEASIKIMRTLISSRPSIYCLTDEHEKAVLCFIYKCLSEIYVAVGQNHNAIRLLVNLGEGTSIDSNVSVDAISIALHKFKHVAIELIHEIREKSSSLEELLMPHFSLEWISCFSWLLALTKSPTVAKNYIYEIFSDLESIHTVFVDYSREILWEVTSAIFWALDRNNVLELNQILKESYTQFPHNLKTLSLMASQKLEDRGLWWTLKQSFLVAPTILGSIMLICVALETTEKESDAFRNRLKSLFRQIALECGKLSSVVHCLRLRFLYDHDTTSLDVAEVNAVESCPWNKNVYVSAISVLPNKLMQLTDVMIEKEMRIHITPDEIQSMRD